jgi:hypothetical protein
MSKNIIKQEECIYCKWYDQDGSDYELRLEAYKICTATNNGNLKGFPFRKKLKCFELNNDLYELE